MSITLITHGGHKVEVDQPAAFKLGYVKNEFESTQEEEITLPHDVSSQALDKIVEYCKYVVDHAEPQIEKPLKSTELKLDEWFQKFVNIDENQLFEIIIAADRYDCPSLLELASAKVASLIRDKSVEEQRKFFQVKSDHSAEDEERIREEIKHAEQSC